MPLLNPGLRGRFAHLFIPALCCLLAALAPCAHAQTESPEDSVAYARALADLAQGNTQRAIERLRTIAERQPEHRGALLDLALAYCQAELPLDAEAALSRLEQGPPLPPAIAEVVRFYRAGHCLPRTPRWQVSAAAGAGRADNLNQAPGIGALFLAPLGVTLPLADSSRPQRDSYLVSEFALSRQPASQGWGMGLYAQQQSYSRQHNFDSGLLQGALSHRQFVGGVRVDSAATLLHQRIGGQSHLNAWSLGVNALGRLPSSGATQSPWETGPVLSLSGFAYPSLPDYRARQTEARWRLQVQAQPNLKLSGDLGWISDQALANRPGGNRRGPSAQFTLQWAPSERQALEVLHRRTALDDASAYSPVFFGDVRRATRQGSWYAAWRYRIAPEWQWRVEARQAVSRDPVPLFTFDAWSLAVMMEWAPR